MPPSASCAPTSVVRSLLKPTTTKAATTTSTMMTMIRAVMRISLSQECLGRAQPAGAGRPRSDGGAAAHQEPPPPPPPPPPPEKPPPPLLLPLEEEVWVAW